ncbi:MAG TPA: alpha-L-fucosidase, partial [Phycisphaerae bacterium]|nr:alpha-L-fucosidase [Phycisphaerae bacterium]
APCAKPSAPTHFEPTWESLKQYTVPEWYLDAKFGIFIHWGVYAVPAHDNEWYPHNMYVRKSPVFKWHRENFGPQSEFGYKDFIPKFTADKWNPEEWARLFRKSGARFVVPVAEHHDGFPMYDCSFSDWTAVKMGPKRDVVGELAKVLRGQGLKFGASSHRAQNWKYYTREADFDTTNPAYFGLYGPTHDPKAPASKEFLDDWLARTNEIVDKYQPDLMWFDFCFEPPEFEPYRKEFAAHYYNRAIEWGREVVINYKHEAYPAEAAVLDIERGKLDDLRPHFWQTDTAVDRKSWGYINDPQYKPVDELVDDLVDIVSKNGCLLLNIGPRADGTIPEEQQKILLDIGRWLSINGEAIYGTRPWKIYGEGPTRTKAGSFTDKDYVPMTAQDIRFTTRGDVLYAVCLDWPEKQWQIRALSTLLPMCRQKIAEVQLVGGEKLKWRHGEDGLIVEAPAARPCDHAFALKITFEKPKPDEKDKK